MMIKACLNGSRAPGEHPAVPITAEALAADAQRVVAAGAGALHVHPRDALGRQSLAAQDIGAALTAIRARCPGIPVGVSTAIWIEPDVGVRLQLIHDWTELPDFVSINFSEPGTAELCAHFLSRGIRIEAGIWTVEDARLLCSHRDANRYLRIVIEPQEPELEAAFATTEAIVRCLDAGGVTLPKLLHGDNEATVWPLLETALQRGYDTRIGLEDTLVLPDGRRTTDNAELVAVAVAKARHLGVL